MTAAAVAVAAFWTLEFFFPGWPGGLSRSSLALYLPRFLPGRNSLDAAGTVEFVTTDVEIALVGALGSPGVSPVALTIGGEDVVAVLFCGNVPCPVWVEIT